VAPVVHEWRPTTPFWLRLFGIVLFGINAVLFVVLTLTADAGVLLWMTLAAMALAGLFGLALASSRIYLSLDPHALRVGLWPFSHRVIQLSDIVQHEIVAVRPSTFGGVGFRKTPGKKTGYLWEAGPGLEIHTRDGEVITVAFAKAPEARAALTAALER